MFFEYNFSKDLIKAYIFKAIKLQKICNVKNSTILKKEPSDHSTHYFSTFFLNSSFELNSILDNFIIPYGVRNQKLSKTSMDNFTVHASLVAQRLKRLPPMWETWVRSLGREDPLEKEMVTHSSTLAWRIPWTEKPGRLQSTGSQRVGHD